MKILIYDLETAPIIGYTWGIFEQNVIEVIRPSFILCFAYKWYGDKKTKVISLPQFEGYNVNKEDDTLLVQKLWDLFDEADIVMAHNGDNFDLRKTYQRFIAHGMPPPSPVATIDTKKIAKRNFWFDSNSLDKLGETLGLGRKVDTGGFDLWKGCMAGDMKSWRKMIKYNKQDVDLLEKVYERLRPYHKTHPHIGDTEILSCPNCASYNTERRGYSRTNAGAEKQRIKCRDCGAWRTVNKHKKLATVTV